MLITALMLCTFTASAKEKPEASVVNNSPAVNAAAPDNINAVFFKTPVMKEVQRRFSQCFSYSDLIQFSKDIVEIEGVKKSVLNHNDGIVDVTFDNNVTLKYYNPLYAKSVRENITKHEANPANRNGKTVWIGNGIENESLFASRTKLLKEVAKTLADCGFDVTYTPTWNDSLAYVSDVILYHGHGAFNGDHWINVGIHSQGIGYELPDGMRVSNGKKNYCIDENYIKRNPKSLKQNSFVYLACCDLTNENKEMVNAFLNKGAAAVVGYEGAATRAAIFGAAFIEQLGMGMTISEAYRYLKKAIDGNLSAQTKHIPHYRIFSKLFEEIDFENNVDAGGDKYNIVYQDNEDPSLLGFIAYNPLVLTAKPDECKIEENDTRLGIKIRNWEFIKKNHTIKSAGVRYLEGARTPYVAYSRNKILIPTGLLKDGVILTKSMPGFKTGTPYCYQAYLETDKGTLYGEVESFCISASDARSELIRLYHMLKGEQWDDASKKNWLSDQPITTWAGVKGSIFSKGMFNVRLENVKNLHIPSDLTLENFTKIENIYFPPGTKVENLTMKNCNMTSQPVNCIARNMIVTNCPRFVNTDLTGTVSINFSNCDKITRFSSIGNETLRNIAISNCNALSKLSVIGNDNSKLNSLDIKNNDKLTNVSLKYCGLTGSLDLSACSNLNFVDIIGLGINKINVVSSDWLSIYDTPISQAYESITGWNKDNFFLESKYVYEFRQIYEGGSEDKPEGFSYLGTKTFNGTNYKVYYKEQFEDGHGFYHPDELKNKKWWKNEFFNDNE